MLSQSELDRIINDTMSVMFVTGHLFARSKTASLRATNLLREAHLVLEQCRVDADLREATRLAVPAKPHLWLVASGP